MKVKHSVVLILGVFAMLFGSLQSGAAAAPTTSSDIPSGQRAAQVRVAIQAYRVGSDGRQCVDVQGNSKKKGANIIQWTCHYKSNQQWDLKNVGGGYVEVKSVRSKKCLDVGGASTRKGANVIQWTCNGQDNQKWHFAHVGDNVYALLPKHARGMCLNVKGGSARKGTNIIQWECVGATNEWWRLVGV